MSATLFFMASAVRVCQIEAPKMQLLREVYQRARRLAAADRGIEKQLAAPVMLTRESIDTLGFRRNQRIGS